MLGRAAAEGGGLLLSKLIESELVQAELARQPFALAFEDQVDALPNVLGHRHLRLVMQELEQLVLLRRDVDGGGDLLPGHGAQTMHDHICTVNEPRGLTVAATFLMGLQNASTLSACCAKAQRGCRLSPPHGPCWPPAWPSPSWWGPDVAERERERSVPPA